jgi:hypothetical protein
MELSMSTVVKELETAYETIRKRHPEVPPALIVVGPSNKASKLGHWAKESWVEKDKLKRELVLHELFLTADHLDREPEQIFGTLLHEAAHALATARGIKDCAGQRHNLKFKAHAEELGMTVQNQGTRAWAWTELTPETAEEYRDTILSIGSAVKAYRKMGTARRDPKRAYSRKVSSAKSMMRFLASEEPSAFRALIAELVGECPNCGERL